VVFGGFDLALTRQGWKCVWYNDYDKYAVKTYNKNFGTNYEPKDITKVDANTIPEHTLLCAGFPCQSFSIAGKRKGFQDTRGTMFFEICRIVKECRTPFLLLENVKGLLSHDEGRTFRTILATLDELGYDAEWQVLNSKHFSVPQNRERVFIIANLREFSKREVFPITETDKEGVGERGVEQINQPKHAGYRTYGVDGMSPSIRARARDDAHSSPKIQVELQGTHEAHNIYGTGGVAPTVREMHGKVTKIISPTIRAEHHNTANVHFIEDVIPRFDGRDGRSCLKAGRVPEISQASQTDGMLRQGSSFGTNNPASKRNVYIEMEVANAVTPDAYLAKGERKRVDGKPVLTSMNERRLRRLTPTECERLQSFPDGWTEGTKESPMSDSQRYKQLGNAVTVNVVQEIAKRLSEVLGL
jgi:DNA (cytosine-5)-methyltransferase 1